MVLSARFPYLLPYLLSAAFLVFVMLATYRRREHPGSSPFLTLLLFELIWVLGALAENLATQNDTKWFIDWLQWFSLVWIPYTIRVFARRFQDRGPTAFDRVAFGFSWLLTLVVAAEPWLNLLRWNPRLIEAYPFAELTYTFSPAVWALVLNAFAYLVWSLVALNRQGPQIALSLGFALPFLVGLGVAFDLRWFWVRDATPLAFGVSALLLAWALWKDQPFDRITPLQARLQALVEERTRELSETQNRLDLILRLTGASAFENNFSAGTSLATTGLYQRLGYSADQIPRLMDDINSLIHPEDLPLVYRALQRHLDGQAPEYYAEFRMKDARGRWHWVNGVGQVVDREPDGRARRLVGMSTSIQKLKQVQQQLEERNEELSRFAYTVSHDLKSPLITIQGFTEALRHDLVAGDPTLVQEDLERIARASRRMGDLLEGVLRLSRLGRQGGPRDSTFAVKDMVQEALLTFGPRFEARGADCQILGGDWPEACGDGVLWSEAIQNLVENALKFVPGDRQPRITLSWDPGRHALLVDDNGPGIAPDQRQRVFGLFEKLDPSVEGSGLGLALVRKIADSSGGQVSIEDSPLGGARFVLQFGQVRSEGACSDETVLT